MIRFENFDPIRSKIINKLVIASGLFTIIFLSISIHPEQANFLSCYFKELTGLPCPTCGLSHSFYAASHLQIVESFKFHLMGPIIFIVMLFLFFKSILEIVTKKEIKIGLNSKITKFTLIVFSFSWLSFWIIRLINDL